jgi:hypothetical protein
MKGKLELRNFKPDSVDLFDGPIPVGTIYTHEKHIAIVSKYLDKARCNRKVLPNLVDEDKKFPPGVEIDFLI